MECEKCKMCGMVVSNLQIHVKLNHRRKYKGYQCQSKDTTNSLQSVQAQNILRQTPEKWDIGRQKAKAELYNNSGIKKTTKRLIEVKECPDCKMKFTVVGNGKHRKKRGRSATNQSFRIYQDHVRACGLGGDYAPQTVIEEHFKVDKSLGHIINEKDTRGRNYDCEGGCVANEYQSDLVTNVKKSPLEVLKEEVEELCRSGNFELKTKSNVEVLEALCAKHGYRAPVYDDEREQGRVSYSIICCVGEVRKAGVGNTRAGARNEAAQRMLDMLRSMLPTEMPANDESSGDASEQDEFAEVAESMKMLKIEQNVAVKSPREIVSETRNELAKLRRAYSKDKSQDYMRMLVELGEEQKFVVACVQEKQKDLIECLVQLNTVPVAVSCAIGTDLKTVENNAARDLLNYLKTLSPVD